MTIGISIKLLRQKERQRQKVFAANIGITQTYLSQIENGIKIPSLEVLQSISTYLKIPLPIMFWLSVTDTDIKPEKQELFKLLKPSIDQFIISLI